MCKYFAVLCTLGEQTMKLRIKIASDTALGRRAFCCTSVSVIVKQWETIKPSVLLRVTLHTVWWSVRPGTHTLSCGVKRVGTVPVHLPCKVCRHHSPPLDPSRPLFLTVYPTIETFPHFTVLLKTMVQKNRFYFKNVHSITLNT